MRRYVGPGRKRDTSRDDEHSHANQGEPIAKSGIERCLAHNVYSSSDGGESPEYTRRLNQHAAPVVVEGQVSVARRASKSKTIFDRA